ncbi:Os07g0297000 [Oryza sativa Japonica Group]|uniref:Os07g0297000 protein n=2 Tax=Oryza sativa subsp. japonica TaxID=39947 RepID=A0A0P0X5D6_ORYSJ|nr:hypothetical protein OsJ_09038 [Oryza sativa Japonica Group]BAC84786.1 hypothetical protein [Oryza sativa Japonica Group]BAT01062.1 Os07g0297000 [Oryza sativa Japonica Group]
MDVDGGRDDRAHRLFHRVSFMETTMVHMFDRNDDMPIPKEEHVASSPSQGKPAEEEEEEFVNVDVDSSYPVIAIRFVVS